MNGAFRKAQMRWIDARLQFGPFDGRTGRVPMLPLPIALDVRDCPTGCTCGRQTHMRIANITDPTRPGYVRYELIEVSEDLDALYRHADTLDPVTERVIIDALRDWA